MLKPFLLLASALMLGAAPAPSYRVTGSIPGPDGAGWDYASINPATHRLFVTHGDAVAVVDLAHGNAVRSIGAINHGHAPVPVPGTDMLAVTSGRDSTVRLIDVTSGRELASLSVGDDPDAAVIDPVSHHLLTMSAHAGTVSEIDLRTRRVVRTITVKPALEYAAIGRGHLLYVNNEDANEIDVVDLARGKMTGTIAMPGCEGPTGMAYDAAQDRLISACANGQAAVVDARARRLVQLVPIARGPDAVLLDARRRVALVPCGTDGALEILSIADPRVVTRLGEIKTEKGARTGAIDANTGIVYLPTARFGPTSAPGQRPPTLPGSFHIIIVEPS